MFGRAVERATPAVESDSIGSVINASNTQRIAVLSLILLVVHAAHVALFWPYAPDAVDRTQIWRNGIVAAHAAMFCIAGCFAAAALFLRRRKLASGRGGLVLAELAGLKSVAARVQRAKGAWEITSRPGEGTCLAFSLPLTAASEPDPPASNRPGGPDPGWRLFESTGRPQTA